MTDYYNGKIAIAIRTARAAIGWSQQEFAEKMGVAKSTVARIETLEMAVRADFIMKAMRVFQGVGVELDLLTTDTIKVVVLEPGIFLATRKLKGSQEHTGDLKQP